MNKRRLELFLFLAAVAAIVAALITHSASDGPLKPAGTEWELGRGGEEGEPDE